MNDLIERQDAIDALDEYCNKHPDASFPVWSLKILEDLPSAQPETHEERTETHACDLISRQAAIDAVYKCADIFAGDMPVMVVKSDAYEALAQLPSAQPEVLACGEGELIAQPEIVQCEDCQHWEQETINDGYCTEMDLRMCDADFYCGYAERKTDEKKNI